VAQLELAPVFETVDEISDDAGAAVGGDGAGEVEFAADAIRAGEGAGDGNRGKGSETDVAEWGSMRSAPARRCAEITRVLDGGAACLAAGGVEEGEAGVGYIRDFHTPDLSGVILKAETNTQTGNTRFKVFGCRGDFSASFGKELKYQAHWPGAISRNRANTSPAGIGWDSPASKRAMRRAISASQAASAPGSGSKSTLSRRRRREEDVDPAAGQAPLLTKRRVKLACERQ